MHGRTAKTALLLRVMCELILGMKLEGEEGATAGAHTGVPCKVLLHVSEKTGEAWIDTPGGRGSVSREFVEEEIARGAETEVVKDIALRGELEAISFGERGSVPKEDRGRTLTPEERRRIFERDGWRCVLCERGVTEETGHAHHGESHAGGGKSIEEHSRDRARDLAELSEADVITLAHVEEVAAMLGIDREGFTAADRNVLEHLLAREGAIGIETIAAATGIAEGMLRSVVEPYLIRKGFLVRTPLGRVATSAARAWRNGRSPHGSQASWN